MSEYHMRTVISLALDTYEQASCQIQNAIEVMNLA